MKYSVNFRLSEQAILNLSVLQKKLHTSKTQIIENALLLYAKNKYPQQKKILQYAGILSSQDAELMLKTINTNKKNKDIYSLDLKI